jgi:hypothetical protein
MWDDPVKAIQKLNANEERQRSPVSRFAKQFLGIVKQFAPKEGEIPISGLEAAFEWLNGREQANREELLNVIATEVSFRGSQIDELIATQENHRRFIEDEMPGLVLDALRRAEGVRAKSRIARLARILVHAAEIGPAADADLAEEYMRIAVELSDRDVLVLDAAIDEFARQQKPGYPEADAVVSARAWTSVPWRSKVGAAGDEIASIGAKLQSFGLASRIEGRTGDTDSFRITERGVKFVEYIRSGAGRET